MRLVNSLFLTSALMLAAVALAASSASAITVRQEPGNTACPAGPIVAAHVVTGGCHATVASNGTIPLLVHTGAAEVVISNCTVTGELRVNSAGAGFITNQVFGGGAACTRLPCDEAAGSMAKIPWSATLAGTGAAPSLEATFCVRPVASGEGGSPTLCTVHGAGSSSGHTYSGAPAPGGESPCEGQPQVEHSGGVTTTNTERVEIS